MDYRFLGATGLKVSTLSFGGANLGGAEVYGSVDIDQAREEVAMCLDAGVNLFDTADAYSEGRSEEMLGVALGPRRGDVLVATKLNSRTGPDPNAIGQSRHHIVRAVHASLRRLGTDWIDILYLHGFDAKTDMESSLRALDDLVRAGTVRYLGCSNYSAWQLMKALSISERRGWERFCVTQIYYSLIAREAEHELIPLCLDQRLSAIAWSPLTGGLLSGRYRSGASGPPEGRFTHVVEPPVADFEHAYRIIDAVVEVAAEHDALPAAVALAWLLERPAVASLTLGARRPEQLAETLQAADLKLTDEQVQRLQDVSDRPLPYPNWHQHKYNPERRA